MIGVKCRCKFCGKRKTVKIAESNLNYTPGDPANKEKFAYLTIDERFMFFGLHSLHACHDCYCIRWGNSQMAAEARDRQLEEAKQKIKRLKERLKKKS